LKDFIIKSSLIVSGVIHLLPITGVLGVKTIEKMYGVPVSDPNLEILLRHRAVLFGLLGTFLIFSAFKPMLQGLAFPAGVLSVVSFIWIAYSTGGYNHLIGRVVFADYVALFCLIVGASFYFFRNA
jgi:hypothetical protein